MFKYLELGVSMINVIKEKRQLLIKIEDTRKEMYKLYNDSGGTTEEVIRISKKLDRLINFYQSTSN